MKGGLKGFADYEILEFLLGLVDVRKDCRIRAKSLCREFGSLKGVLDASYDDLIKVDGIGARTAEAMLFVKALVTRYLAGELRETGSVLDSPGAVISYFSAYYGGTPREEFCVVYVNAAGSVLHVAGYQQGTVNFSYVYPRNIISDALRQEAAAMILVHNHPSGRMEPSEADVSFTEKIAELAGKMEITLLDHLIITADGYFSFKEEGLL